jgi:hypothetical protein|eukprot:3494914-Prymnesium_polylepis.3
MAEAAPQPDELASPGGKVYTLKKGSGRYGYDGVTAPHGPEKGGYFLRLYATREPIARDCGRTRS